MPTNIASATLAAWTSKRKTRTSPKGWITGDAVCCPHNGESIDKRSRGAVIVSGESITYHCFNCGFKTRYEPGHPLSYRFRKLLSWLGLDDLEIHRLNIEALREKERQEALGIIKPLEVKEELKVSFQKFPLPEESVSLYGWVEFLELKGSPYPTEFVDIVSYVASRKVDMRKYDLYWSTSKLQRMSKRVIVPFTWKNEIIGYSARAIQDGIKPKYWAQHDSGYVFNVDKQERDWKFVVVVEGVFDALAIDGVAVLRAEVNTQQIDIIESLEREIIVVPDWNKAGGKLIDVALQNKWAVSFPVWLDTCEDVNHAVQQYGKLFVLKTILEGVERSRLKIELKRRQHR